MPFSYTDYIKGFAIIGIVLTATGDCDLHVLLKNLMGNLKVEMHSHKVNQDVTIFCIGEFWNQLCVQMDQVLYLTYTY